MGAYAFQGGVGEATAGEDGGGGAYTWTGEGGCDEKWKEREDGGCEAHIGWVRVGSV